MSENTEGTWDANEHFTPGVATTHTMGHDLANGPAYCIECSAAWANWVRWPCNGSKGGSGE